ncbi:hypothetical protein PISMIDRAFT_211628 [Pisolithus microcarpus 441]|uniref:Unplaced genomic scaffold scaffold_134, whole genome shotgun sequence n=1 Tax=Pisolithus microcarpus 441 TaxID=765257 RepID=A0A0C9YUV3_9AGAM|nr:hypothetical protein PISMIDRAFT_211628 [Pisolithus microcarpus 441]
MYSLVLHLARASPMDTSGVRTGLEIERCHCPHTKGALASNFNRRLPGTFPPPESSIR